MWISGGLGAKGPLGDVWCLDLATEQWRQLAPAGTGITPRFGHSSSIVGHSLVMVGGVNHLDSCQPGVAVLNLQTGCCVEYQLPGMGTGKSMLLINHSHILSSNKKEIWIIGGGGNCFSFGTFFNSHSALIKLEDLC
ncbi:hypothetical protein J6590_031796 [Homalodisca vitripennis]|nr:hypothetical protein J6590_031796 [Homalodisca vitripennis]